MDDLNTIIRHQGHINIIINIAIAMRLINDETIIPNMMMMMTKIRRIYLRLGAQSFEHANVLSEKINFSALGGPGVAIFGTDDLHPMY